MSDVKAKVVVVGYGDMNQKIKTELENQGVEVISNEEANNKIALIGGGIGLLSKGSKELIIANVYKGEKKAEAIFNQAYYEHPSKENKRQSQKLKSMKFRR